jgi:hypothetical protein
MIIKKRVLLSIIPTISVALFGCSHDGAGNVIKVLDRVSCDPSEDYCPQEKIDNIWQLCLQSGFHEKLGDKKVVSSRSITELVDGEIEKKGIVSETEEEVSADGIVFNNSVDKQGTIKTNAKGYCIGSEYIIR